jgi:hypothetical protein
VSEEKPTFLEVDPGPLGGSILDIKTEISYDGENWIDVSGDVAGFALRPVVAAPITFSGTFITSPPSQVGKPVYFEGVRLGTISEDDRCGNWKVKNEATPEQVDRMFQNQRRRFAREGSAYWKRYRRRSRHVRHRRVVR